jgi:parallel beta-helix repeat protein
MKKLITCLVVCALSGVTFAEIHHVPADFPTIQYAIDAALDDDEIIVAPGTYTGTDNEPVVDMLGKEVWLHSSAGAEVTFIDGEGARRGIYCVNNETSNPIIEGFTITNGYCPGSGGGMYNVNSNPTLTNCTFTNNTADYGGGMHNYQSSPTLTDCTITNNTAIYGGGMSNWESSSPTLTNCTFTGNTAYDGGGMSNWESSSPTLTNCTFTGNTANEYGGGIRNGIGNYTLTSCTFENNTADKGGGMYNDNGNYTLENCTFETNIASQDGGGMFNTDNNLTLTNCTFAGNIASQNGGGMYNHSSSPTLTDCEITSNSASTGGGMWNWESNSTLTNNSICGNSSDQIFGEWTNGGGNIVSEVCPWNQGACCTNNNCLVSEQEDCGTFFGQWQGEGTTCEDNPCPTSCLGDVTGDGQVDVSDILVVISVWGACP